MIKVTLINILLLTILISCFDNTITLKPDLEGACLKRTTGMLEELLSQDTTKIENLEDILLSKSMGENGELKTMSFSDAQKLICDLKTKSVLNYPLPVLEVKDKNQWIIFSNAKGMWGPVWALILVDLNDKKIIKMKCDHEHEAPVSETNFQSMEYSNRYDSLQLNESNFNSAEIDGVSGATKTHEAYFKVITNAIEYYNL